MIRRRCQGHANYRFYFGNGRSCFRIRESLSILHANSLALNAPGTSMLHPMQQAAIASPSPTSSSFAGLLAALTAPASKGTPAWNDDDLADDVATLSYERALRNHNRYKPADTGDGASAQAADSRSCRNCGALPSHAAPVAQPVNLPAEPGWSEDEKPQSAPGVSTIFDQNRKCASITIRLSKAEGEQLRRRAAEAGLTVSAYLRSCTFEAEALRAQVKEVLAELRKTSSTEKQSAKTAIRRSWFEWLWRLMPQWHTGQHVARV